MASSLLSTKTRDAGTAGRRDDGTTGRAVAFGDSVEERALDRDVVELWEGEIGRAHGERHVAREVIGHERRVSVDEERLEKGDEPRSLGGDDERLLAKRSTRWRWFGDSLVWVL